MQTAQINISVNAQGANKSVQDLSNSISQAGGSAQSLRTQLRQVTQELQGLEPGSARFTELSQRAGQLRDQIQDTSAVISATAGNVVENLGGALSNTVQIGVAGFQALSAAQVLFGNENEEVQRSIQKLTALLNLSQAIQTFGGLGDKLTEIRAGFTPLLQQLGLMKTAQTQVAVSSGAAAVAMEGEAVAAGTASFATRAFGAALNALPLVAVITGLGLLAYNLLSTSENTEEAAKQKEALIAETEAYNKKLDEENQKIGQEAGQYLQLVFQLKNTNINTKERKSLIDLINSTYGTTFKNLKDESAFQAQLNISIKEYIALQVLRARAQAKQKESEAAIGALIKAQDELNKYTAQYAGMSKQQIEDFQLAKYGVADYDNQIINLNFNLKQAEKRAEAFALQQGDLDAEIKKLTKTTDYHVRSVQTQTKAVADQGKVVTQTTQELKDYESIYRSIQGVVEENTKLEESLYKKRSENFDKTVNLVELETKSKEEAAIKQYEAIKTAIDKEITKGKLRKEEKKKLNEAIIENEKALNVKLNLLSEERSLQIQIETTKQLETYQKTYEYLKNESESLQKEIRFGDGNTTDTLIGLRNKETQAFIENINTKLIRSKYSNQIELDEFEKLLRDRLELSNQYATKEAEEKKSIAESEYQKILDQEKLRLEAQKDLKVTFIKNENGEIIKSRIEIVDKEKQALIDMDQSVRQLKLESLNRDLEDAKKTLFKAKDQKEKIAAQELVNQAEINYQLFNQSLILADELAVNKKLTEENLNQEILNLNEEKNTKILEADTELNAKVKEQTIKTEDEILDEKIKRIDQYLEFIQQQFQQASSVISEFAKQQEDIRTTQLEDAISLDKERIENQYASQLISREQYDNALEQLDEKRQQQQLQINRKNFRTEKALNLVGATIDGARAVLGAFYGTQGGLIARQIAATLAGIFAASQIALIARQEFKAADGGIVPGMGSGDIDSVPARLAPGEAVINSRSTQAFLPLLSAINQANGGQSFVPELPPTNQPQTFAPVFVENKDRQPIRAYVVESDISNAQKRISRIERSTRF